MSKPSFACRLLGLIHRFEDLLLVVVLTVMIVLAATDILARLLVGGGPLWISPALRVMVLWLGLLGGMVATRSREHIAIDLVKRLASARVSQAIAVLTSAFAAAICGLIAWHSQAYVELAREFGDMAFGDIPAWPLQIIIPLSFAVMTLRFAIQAVESLIHSLRGSTPETQNGGTKA